MAFNFYALKLCGVCIIVFLMQILIPGFTELFLQSQDRIFEIWRFVTSIFLHGDLGHLLYNLFALALFGSIVERFIGGKKFLVTFFASGILASLISVNFYTSSLGASGAIFGVIGILIVLRPLMMIWAFGMPMPVILAGILWAAGDIIGAYAFISGDPIDRTGNIAHLSGMVFGFILGFLFKDKRSFNRFREEGEIDEKIIRDWEDKHILGTR